MSRDYRSEFRESFRESFREARWTFWRVALWLLLPISAFGAIGYGCSWFGEAAQVAREQFGPRGGLAKYEWFKNAHAQLQRKRSDLDAFKARMDAARARADRGDRFAAERADLTESEWIGLLSSYNGLVAEYNAASSKFNWAPFKGEVPETVEPYTTGAK